MCFMPQSGNCIKLYSTYLTKHVGGRNEAKPTWNERLETSAAVFSPCGQEPLPVIPGALCQSVLVSLQLGLGAGWHIP